jgi:putative oxidoreductase
MTTRAAAVTRIAAWLDTLERAAWIPTLLVRLFVGYFFFVTGVAKVQNLDAMTERFAEWGIPFPAFSAALSGCTELLGGALLVVGLLTRLASIPLFVNMVVAIATVNVKRVGGLDEFVELSEPLYALVFLWLFFTGPGRVSLDHLLRRWLCPASPLPRSDPRTASR